MLLLAEPISRGVGFITSISSGISSPSDDCESEIIKQVSRISPELDSVGNRLVRFAFWVSGEVISGELVFS